MYDVIPSTPDEPALGPAEIPLDTPRPHPAPGEVTLHNWQDPPWNIWGLDHLTELVPTAIIGTAATRDASILRPLEGLPAEECGERVAATWARSLVVLKDGRLAGEWYGEGFRPSTRHTLMSVSKSLCGLLVARLIGQGLLRPGDPIGAIVPRLKDTAYGGATVQQALDMQVAVHYDETYHDPAAHVAQQDRVAGWRPPMSGDPADTYEFLTTLRPAGHHGVHLQYCSATTDALAWVVEQVTGTRYHEAMSAEIWSRLGTEHDAVVTVDTGGFAFANGGIACTTRDLARVGQLMLDGGAVAGEQVVPESFVAATFAGGSTDAAAGSIFQSVHPGGSYLNQWWATGDDVQAIYGAGIHGQYLWVDPVRRVVIAKFGASPEATSRELLEANSLFLRRLADTC